MYYKLFNFKTKYIKPFLIAALINDFRICYLLYTTTWLQSLTLEEEKLLIINQQNPCFNIIKDKWL